MEKSLVNDLCSPLVARWRFNQIDRQRVWIPAAIGIHTNLRFERTLLQHRNLDGIAAKLEAGWNAFHKISFAALDIGPVPPDALTDEIAK